MPDSAVSADVSETLQTVLTDALITLAPSPPVAEGHDLATPVTINPNPPRVTLFLFEAGEDATQRNRPPVCAMVPPSLPSEDPPTARRLRYLTNEALKLTLAQLALEERSGIWHVVQQPFRLLVAYGICVVNLEPLEKRKHVPGRVRQTDPPRGTVTHDGLDSDSRPPSSPLSPQHPGSKVYLRCQSTEETFRKGATISFDDIRFQDTNRPARLPARNVSDRQARRSR
jgi:hypothetical protein